MKVLFIGGFLGSGKTTIVNRIVHDIAESGMTVAIVENEIGETGIDQDILGGSAKITAISGGCVCCELFGDLLAAINELDEKVAPDWLVIETTGMAALDRIRENYLKFGKASIPFCTATVVDCSRFELLWTAMKPLLKGQLAETDVVLLSKSDISAPSDNLLSIITESSGGSKIIDVSNGHEEETWARMLAVIKERTLHVGAR